MSTKRGKSGFPIECLIRPSEGTPLEDPGFMNPTIPEKLFQRGHINIEGNPTNQRSQFYSADNRELYMLLQRKCLGTSADNTIKAFDGKKDGRGAHLRL